MILPLATVQTIEGKIDINDYETLQIARAMLHHIERKLNNRKYETKKYLNQIDKLNEPTKRKVGRPKGSFKHKPKLVKVNHIITKEPFETVAEFKKRQKEEQHG